MQIRIDTCMLLLRLMLLVKMLEWWWWRDDLSTIEDHVTKMGVLTVVASFSIINSSFFHIDHDVDAPSVVARRAVHDTRTHNHPTQKGRKKTVKGLYHCYMCLGCNARKTIVKYVHSNSVI